MRIYFTFFYIINHLYTTHTHSHNKNIKKKQMNQNPKLVLFCVFHKPLEQYVNSAIYFGVNETYAKSANGHRNIIMEHELAKYDPFLQKRGYMETSVYLHAYWNNLYANYEYVGFMQYDMIMTSDLTHLDSSTIYALPAGRNIVDNGKWHDLMFREFCDYDFLMDSYNRHFGTNIQMSDFESMPITLWQTNVYPVAVYKKLCSWMEKLVDEIYLSRDMPSRNYTQFGTIGGYTERAICIFNAIELKNGMKLGHLHIRDNQISGIVKQQYIPESFLNRYAKDIHTKYIKNITGDTPHSTFSMFKAVTELNGVTYSCERTNIYEKNGLTFQRSDDSTVRNCGFDIDASDPRIFILGEKVYVLMIVFSPFEHQNYCLAITEFDNWNPVFLQIQNVPKNRIEKNWAPFVKNGELYFVYNFDPLIVLKYDFNQDGLCEIIFSQIPLNELPFNTSNTYLRGGSNLLPMEDQQHYIGGCHSRIFKNGNFEHYTHMVVLDTASWKLRYVSKPIMYLGGPTEKLNSWHERPNMKKELVYRENILMDKDPLTIQDPVSLYKSGDGNYYITNNVRDSVSLLYSISWKNLDRFYETEEKDIGYFDNIVRDMAFGVW